MGYTEKIHTAYLSRSPERRAMKPNLRRRVPQRLIYVAASLLLIFLFYLTHHSTPPSSSGAKKPIVSRPSVEKNPKNKHTTSSSDAETLPCRSLPGAEDVVVILKTGSTELQDKLPVHLNTTLRCYPNYLLFSDYEESFHGEHIYDALEFTTPSMREQNPDFELWRRLQKGGGRSALKPSELSGPISRPNSAMGKPENPGWKLDKWKFLPMVNRTLSEYPDKKWYVFVETDTYILWQTLLNYLSAMDWKKPYYVGGQIWIGDIQFAHGGTGFAVSRPALESVVQMFRDRQEEWESFTDGHWAGDCVLGKAMKDSGSPMTMAWPIWQGDDVGNMNYDRKDGHRLWCFPTVSYHHLGPGVVQDMWEFEQEWISKVNVRQRTADESVGNTND